MKKRHEEWLKLTGGTPLKVANPVRPPLLIIDLPGFRRMEDMILLNPPFRGEVSSEVESFAKYLSEETFGINEDDTLFQDPEGYEDLLVWSAEWQAVDDRYYEHEEQYETSEATDDECVVILLRLGLDFRDGNGQPLRCTKLFSRQAEAAAKGLLGKMPDRAAAGLESWSKAVESAARQFMSKKRTG